MKPLHNLNAKKISIYFEDIINLFLRSGDQSIGELITQIELLSLKYKNDLDPTNQDLNSFKGDMFEIFCEIFFEAYHNDPKVGLTNYTPVPLEEDYGVDAIGTNVLGDQCAVQCKYRSNPLEVIDLASMAKTYSSARELSNISLNNHDTLWLITTGGGATEPCHKVFRKKLRVIHRDIIAGRVDGNLSFWKEAQDRINSTIGNPSNITFSL